MEIETIQLITSAVDAGAWVLTIYILMSDRRKLAEITQRFIEHLETEAALRRVELAARVENLTRT